MKTFQNLKIKLPKSNKHNFFIALKEEISKSNWIVRNDLIENYKKNSFSIDKDVLCVESPNFRIDNKTFKGILWLWDYNEYYEVFNIIPIDSNKLNKDEYNYILTSFNQNIVVKISNRFNATIEISKAIKDIFETIGSSAYDSLKSFSYSANKETGNTNPYDFKRWCEFVFIIFKRKIDLSPAELETWLLENGWSTELSTKLSLDFEYSLELLNQYEQNY